MIRWLGDFEAAQQGTIFLDEIGELPLHAQVKLLRVLQESEIKRLGSTKTIKLNVRVIAATNRNLLVEVAADRFRADLQDHRFPNQRCRWRIDIDANRARGLALWFCRYRTEKIHDEGSPLRCNSFAGSALGPLFLE